MIRETVHPLLVAISVLARSQKHINSRHIKYAPLLESGMTPEKARGWMWKMFLGEEEDSFAMRLEHARLTTFGSERKYGWGQGT
jgi:hypothetical protein